MALSIDEFLATVDEFQKLKTSFDLSSSTMPLGYVLAKSAAFKGSQLETTQETSLQVFFDANKLVAAAQASWDSKELSRSYCLREKGAPLLERDNWKILKANREAEKCRAEKIKEREEQKSKREAKLQSPPRGRRTAASKKATLKQAALPANPSHYKPNKTNHFADDEDVTYFLEDERTRDNDSEDDMVDSEKPALEVGPVATPKIIKTSNPLAEPNLERRSEDDDTTGKSDQKKIKIDLLSI
ncbi:hypothetical protein DL95DRAFT_510301 [Leptodontidium sp. 2 PMI_412]|nr:hypothetical protein DL95DRAFT_510301 [Leptodontidium sp. 2 PMI_412]